MGGGIRGPDAISAANCYLMILRLVGGAGGVPPA
jgi:hypothetical protein